MQVYYDIITLPNTNPGCRDAIFNIISKYSNKFAKSGNEFIRIDDSFDLPFYILNGYVLGIDNRNNCTIHYLQTYTTMTIISDTLFYFLCKTNDVANTPVGAFCWIKENGKNYIGVSTGSCTGQIDSMEFSYKGNPENRYFSIKKHAQFELEPPNLVFITASIISGNDGGDFQTLSEFRSCSTVTYNTMVSVNHANYYAIGTNTLIRDTGL